MEKAAPKLKIADFESLTAGEIPVLLDFYADWCEPCVMLEEILVELESRMQLGLRIIKIDIDEQPDLASHFGFRSVPWLLLYHHGNEVWRMHGFMMASDLERVVKEHCKIA
jgi:thioredoxin 1